MNHLQAIVGHVLGAWLLCVAVSASLAATTTTTDKPPPSSGSRFDDSPVIETAAGAAAPDIAVVDAGDDGGGVGGGGGGGGGVQTNAPNCQEVRTAFQLREIGPVKWVPDVPQHGGELQVCVAGESSCCTRKMEERYQWASRRDLGHALRSASSALKFLVARNAAAIAETLDSLLRQSQNSTEELLTRDYPALGRRALAPARRLYAALGRHLSPASGAPAPGLRDAVASFYDDLFPAVVASRLLEQRSEATEERVVVTEADATDPGSESTAAPSLSGSLVGATTVGGGTPPMPGTAYEACVRRLRAPLNPFGPVPLTMGARVEMAARAAGSFVRALTAGVEVINATEHVAVTRECARVLLRVQYCAHCGGLTLIKPCAGLCLNALRACLAGVPDIDQDFRDFVAGVSRLGSRLLAPPSDIQHSLLGMRDLVAGALLHARVHAQRILAMVAQSCGPPPPTGPGDAEQEKDVSSSTGDEARSTMVNSRFSDLPLWPDRSKRPRSLRNLVLEFRKSLPVYEGFYGTLPQRLCETQFAAPEGSLCWDGNGVVETYSRPVVGTSLQEQQQNPELKVRGVEPAVTLIAIKLHQINQMLRAEASGVVGGPGMGGPIVGGAPPVVSERGAAGGGRDGGSGDCDDEDGCAGSGSGGALGRPEPVSRPEAPKPAITQKDGATRVQSNSKNRPGNSAPHNHHHRNHHRLLATAVAIVAVTTMW